MKKRIIIVGLMVMVFLTSVFFLAYSITNNKDSKDKLTNNNTLSTNDNLGEGVSIIIKTKDANGDFSDYKKYKLADFKSNFNYIGKDNKQDLQGFMKKLGYSLESDNKQELSFIKTSITSFESGKYYLGATAEGYICIYKADEQGQLFIEDRQNHIGRKTLEDLSEYEQNMIINNELSYNSNEEALDALSEYDS